MAPNFGGELSRQGAAAVGHTTATRSGEALTAPAAALLGDNLLVPNQPIHF